MWSDAGTRVLKLLGVTAVALAVFRSTELIDFAFSDMFFVERACEDADAKQRCGLFPLLHQSFWQSVRSVGHDIPLYIMGVVCLHMTWLMMFNPNKRLADIYPPMVAIVTALAGPLFLVNIVLKEYWGRPRPGQTADFAGVHPYVPPGDISTYCESNCSFVSGEASAAFWLLALMFYFKGKCRNWFIIGATMLASSISLLRVIFGRHYISDVVMAGLFTLVLMSFSVWLLQSGAIRRILAAMLKFSNTYAWGRRKWRN